MRFRLFSPGMWLIVLVVACVSSVAAAAGPKIYIVTDLEGASGVYKFSQSREKETPLGQKAMEYLMGDIAAVVRGLRDAGAGEILVLDGHGLQAFVPHLMEPGAKYITSEPGARHHSDPPGRFLMWGLDKSYAGFIIVGQHAMMGTPDGVLHHTQSSRGENRYWYNGVESGEMAQVAAYAGHYGVPPILISGDEAACREARKFFGEPCVTVAVKRGIGREAAVLYPFAETRQALYEGAKRAVAAIPQCKPYVLKLPIQAKKQWLVFEGPEKKPRLMVKEGTIADGLHIFDF
jgi:D-amino peptidase